jgi:hypothetical protein
VKLVEPILELLPAYAVIRSFNNRGPMDHVVTRDPVSSLPKGGIEN